MKFFSQTLMYKVLIHPFDCAQRMNNYSFILCFPWIVAHFILGVIIALIVDTIHAWIKAGE